MKVFRKLFLLMLIVAISMPICFLSGCTSDIEIISEKKAVSIVTEYYEKVKSYIENAGYTLDDSECIKPQLIEDEGYPRRASSRLYFNRNGVYFISSLYLSLTEKRVGITTTLYTNHDSLENNQVSSDIQTILSIQNIVSERQFTADEYVDFLTQDEYIAEWNELTAQHRCNFFDFWGDISFYYFEYKKYDNELKGVYPFSYPRYEHFIQSYSKKLF